MRASRLRGLADRWASPRTLWPFLASAGVNLTAFSFLANAPRGADMPPPQLIIPVLLVEPFPEPEPVLPPPPPDPLPAGPVTSDTPVPPPVRTERPQPEAPDTGLQSPIIAATGEATDAAPPVASDETADNRDLPVLSEREVRAAAALRAFSCNRSGMARPAYCPDETDGVEAAPGPVAEAGVIASKEWADFEIRKPDPEVRRIMAEDCPPQDGVINDLVVQDTSTYYRQGAHSGAGSLSRNSANKRCN